MDCGVVRDDHYVKISVVGGAANRVQVGDGGVLAAVLAQEQVHVCVVVVAELLRLDGLVLGREYGRAAHRGKDGGLGGGGSSGDGGGGGGGCSVI